MSIERPGFETAMSGEQIAIGVLTAGLCLVGIWHREWLVQETRKGRRLSNWCGKTRALWIVTILLGVGVLWGVLLALDIVHPVKW